MAKVLIIPDVHLKPYMFDLADKLMEKANLDTAVFLGDLVDDWNQENNIELYRETINRAIKFKEDHPKSLYCWGNHEVGYFATWYCSGNSNLYKNEILSLINAYEVACEPKYIQYIDDIIFSHAGLDKHTFSFIELLNNKKFESVQEIADSFNQMSVEAMGDSISSLWLRPELGYYSRFTQIIGHNPVKAPVYMQNTWILDTFISTRDNKIVGLPTLTIFDTETYDIEFYNTDLEKYCSQDRLHWKSLIEEELV